MHRSWAEKSRRNPQCAAGDGQEKYQDARKIMEGSTGCTHDPGDVMLNPTEGPNSSSEGEAEADPMVCPLSLS